MDYDFDKAEDLIVFAVKVYNAEFMGDDFIGYKFVGDQRDFWNYLLFDKHEKGADFSFLNAEWLKSNNVDVLPHDSEVWSGTHE